MQEFIEKIDKELKMLKKRVGDKDQMSPGDLDLLIKLTKAKKNILASEMYEGEGYSKDDGMWRAEGSYDSGNSYRHRAANGRYARESRDYSGDDYSRRRGYSRTSGADYMIEKLESMMDEAGPKEREAIEKCIKQLENA